MSLCCLQATSTCRLRNVARLQASRWVCLDTHVDVVVVQSDGLLRGLRLDLLTNRFSELFTTADVDW